jgi:hypothetical protein
MGKQIPPITTDELAFLAAVDSDETIREAEWNAFGDERERYDAPSCFDRDTGIPCAGEF